MPENELLIRQVIDLLNSKTEYAVLRNFDELPQANSARDIDIAIPRKKFKLIKADLLAIIERLGWQIVTYLDSDRLLTLVTGKVGHDNDVYLVQWDFFFDTSIRGVRLLSIGDLLDGRVFNGFLWHASTAVQFLDKYLYDRAVGASYPEKYSHILKAARALPAVKGKLRRVFGCDTVEQCDTTSTLRLLLHATLYNLRRRPLYFLTGLGRWAWSYLRNYLLTPTGFTVGFTGPDGSGKTTVIDTMLASMASVFGKAHICLHFRPTLFGNLGDVAQKAGVKKDVDRNFSDPHRGGRTSVFSSLARLTYYTIDYMVGYWLRVRPATRITRFVVFDRYFTDIICDPRRTRIYLPYKLLNGWRRLLIPSLDYNILLTAPTDTILARKQELTRADIDSINDTIDRLASQHGYTKVLNIGTPAQTSAAILRHIFSSQHSKNLIRLNQ